MRLVLASALMLSVSAPAMATTFVSGLVAAGTIVSLDTVSDPQFDSTPITSIGSYSAAANSFAVVDPYAIANYLSVRATWASANAGTVDLGWGWLAQSGGSGLYSATGTNNVQYNWKYTFTASGDGVFSGSYSVVGTGDTFGLQPIYGAWDLPFGPYGGDASDPTGSGTFSVPIVSGQTYTMALFNFGNVLNNAGLTLRGDATAHFDWNITYQGAVPEPASWAMMITGFGLVGAAARRRRAAIA